MEIEADVDVEIDMDVEVHVLSQRIAGQSADKYT
jgi:hypothetical protein